MQPRSESDVILKTLTLTFGGKEYVVPVLRMRQAAEWRKAFFERTREVSEAMPMNFAGDSAELSKAIGRGLTGALLQFPEKIPELVFAYAPNLPKEEILEAAYDQEFSRAFAAIWGVAFEPFLASLGTMIHMQRSAKTAASPVPSAESSTLH